MEIVIEITFPDFKSQTYFYRGTVGGVTAMTLDLRSKVGGFHSRSRRYQVYSTRLRTDKPSRYVTSHLGQLSLPSLRGR